MAGFVTRLGGKSTISEDVSILEETSTSMAWVS